MMFKNLQDSPYLEGTIREVLDHIIFLGTSSCDPRDKVGLQISSKELDTPVLVSFTDQARLTSERVLNSCAKISQSKKAFQLDEVSSYPLSPIPF